MIRTQIQLTEEQVKKLKTIASSQHQSIAKIIRQAVDSFMVSRGRLDFEERQKKAIAAAGRFRSGVNDLSEGHDRYLIKAFGNRHGICLRQTLYRTGLQVYSV